MTDKAKPSETDLLVEIRDELQATNKTVQGILRWTRFANIPKLREVLENELDTQEKILAYENTDGLNGLKELATISNTPQRTIYDWWQSWFRLGLVDESGTRKGRMIKIVSLENIGIRVPKKTIGKQEVVTQAGESQQTTAEEDSSSGHVDERTAVQEGEGIT